MKQDGFDRLEQKTPQQLLLRELVHEFGFPPIVAKALTRRIEEYVDSLDAGEDRPGTIRYIAISKEEPPGKKVGEMKRIQVCLNLYAPDDIQVLKKHGVHALRKVKIARLTIETEEQGAYLTQEDLALLLNISIRTVRRAIKEIRNQNIAVPTRGQKKDIGPNVSHKGRIVDLWVRGYQYSEIEKRAFHSIAAIQRYIEDFSAVVILTEKRMSLASIRKATRLSERLIKEYQQIYTKYADTDNPRLKELKELKEDLTDYSKKKFHEKERGGGVK